MQQIILILLAVLVALLCFVVYFGYRSYRELKIEVNKNSLDLEALRTLVNRLLETDEKTNSKIAEFYKSPTGQNLTHFTNESIEEVEEVSDDAEVEQVEEVSDDAEIEQVDEVSDDESEEEDNAEEEDDAEEEEEASEEGEEEEASEEDDEEEEEAEAEEVKIEEAEVVIEEPEGIALNTEETEDYPENIKKRGRAKHPTQSAKDFEVGQKVNFEGKDFEVYLAKNGVKRWRLSE